MPSDTLRPATRLVHRGEPCVDPAPLVPPIYETSTYVFANAAEVLAYNEGHSSRFLYSRYENPTIVEVERRLAALEGAEAGLLFSSGMAATATTLVTLLEAGDEVVCSAAIYGGTMHLLEDVLSRFGVSPRFVDFRRVQDVSSVLSDRTRLVWFESPINPTLRCVDIAAVASACRPRGVISVVDNTFASPINQQPLKFGVDLVMHSCTKYLNGHSDLTAGVIVGPRALLDRISRTRRLLGGVLDASVAHSLGRGLKTLGVRMARHNASAQLIAERLAGDPRVSAVWYPGLPSHPDHAIARRQMSGFGGMVCIDLHGSYERAVAAFDRLRVIQRAASLGGVESLCSLPVLTSQWGHSDEQLAAAGITRGMLRLSIGLEDPEDLLADLDQALR